MLVNVARCLVPVYCSFEYIIHFGRKHAQLTVHIEIKTYRSGLKISFSFFWSTFLIKSSKLSVKTYETLITFLFNQLSINSGSTRNIPNDGKEVSKHFTMEIKWQTGQRTCFPGLYTGEVAWRHNLANLIYWWIEVVCQW